MKIPTKQKLYGLENKFEQAKRREINVSLGQGTRSWARAFGRKQKYLASLKVEIELIEKGYLEIIETAELARTELTQSGKVQILKERIVNETKKLPKGKSCLVSFDIPEDVRRLRNQLRYLLKKAGFSMLQRSVWETKKDVYKDLVELVKETGLKPEWVRVYLVTDETIEND